METPAGRRKDLRGILARWAWGPLEHREAVLVMHVVAVPVVEGAMPAGFGLRKTHHRQNVRHTFREWFVTGSSGFTVEGLCSRRGGTGVPCLHAAWNKVDVVPLGRYWHLVTEKREEETHSVFLPGLY